MISVIMPCLNEEASLEKCIKTAKKHADEVIVVDNGSTDGSKKIADKYADVTLTMPMRGYGNACRFGLELAAGDKVIMADPDGSYDFNEIPRFSEALEHHDFIIGNRFHEIEEGAMSWSHKHVGNPIIRFLMKTKGICLTETSTGFIGIHKNLLDCLHLKQGGMEFSSELLIKASHAGMTMMQVPITYHVRAGASKLRTFRDGFRHVRYLVGA